MGFTCGWGDNTQTSVQRVHTMSSAHHIRARYPRNPMRKLIHSPRKGGSRTVVWQARRSSESCTKRMYRKPRRGMGPPGGERLKDHKGQRVPSASEECGSSSFWSLGMQVCVLLQSPPLQRRSYKPLPFGLFLVLDMLCLTYTVFEFVNKI